MEDLEGATRFLQTLNSTPDAESPRAQRLNCQTALLWLCLGDVDAARACVVVSTGKDDGFEAGSEQKVILALAHMADSNFEAAANEDVDMGDKAMYMQNLGVCLLYLSKMKEVRSLIAIPPYSFFIPPSSPPFLSLPFLSPFPSLPIPRKIPTPRPASISERSSHHDTPSTR
jgi:hypothetical protein